MVLCRSSRFESPTKGWPADAFPCQVAICRVDPHFDPSRLRSRGRLNRRLDLAGCPDHLSFRLVLALQLNEEVAAHRLQHHIDLGPILQSTQPVVVRRLEFEVIQLQLLLAFTLLVHQHGFDEYRAFFGWPLRASVLLPLEFPPLKF
jgi:hypothetical protein